MLNFNPEKRFQIWNIIHIELKRFQRAVKPEKLTVVSVVSSHFWWMSKVNKCEKIARNVLRGFPRSQKKVKKAEGTCENNGQRSCWRHHGEKWKNFFHFSSLCNPLKTLIFNINIFLYGTQPIFVLNLNHFIKIYHYLWALTTSTIEIGMLRHVGMCQSFCRVYPIGRLKLQKFLEQIERVLVLALIESSPKRLFLEVRQWSHELFARHQVLSDDAKVTGWSEEVFWWRSK